MTANTAAATDTQQEDFNQVSKPYRTYVLTILTLVYAFNFIDRQIIGILSPFIKADLGLNDAQLGWLKGIYFAVLYTIVGWPTVIVESILWWCHLLYGVALLHYLAWRPLILSWR